MRGANDLERATTNPGAAPQLLGEVREFFVDKLIPERQALNHTLYVTDNETAGRACQEHRDRFCKGTSSCSNVRI